MQVTVTITADHKVIAKLLDALEDTAKVVHYAHLATPAEHPDLPEPVFEPITKSVAKAPIEEVTGPTAEWVFAEADPTPEPAPAPEEPAKRRGRPASKTKDKPFKVVPKEEKKELSMIDVRAAMTGYLAANSEEAAGKLLKTHGGGAAKLSQLAPEFYEAVYTAAVTPVVKDDEFNDEIPDLTA